MIPTLLSPLIYRIILKKNRTFAYAPQASTRENNFRKNSRYNNNKQMPQIYA